MEAPIVNCEQRVSTCSYQWMAFRHAQILLMQRMTWQGIAVGGSLGANIGDMREVLDV